MTITPEQRAANVISDYLAADLDVVNGAEGEKRTIESLIAAAIREAEDAALERAVAVAEVLRDACEVASDEAGKSSLVQASSAQAFAARKIADRIRSLKHKDT